MITRFIKKTPWLVWCSVILAMTFVAGVGFGWSFQTKALDGAPPSFFEGRTISFDMTLNNVDPLASAGTVTVSWTVLDDSCNDSSDWNICPAVNVFMDS